MEGRREGREATEPPSRGIVVPTVVGRIRAFVITIITISPTVARRLRGGDWALRLAMVAPCGEKVQDRCPHHHSAFVQCSKPFVCLCHGSAKIGDRRRPVLRWKRLVV